MQLPLTETYGRTLVFFALEVRSPLPPLSLSSIINEASRPKARAEDARGRPCRESYVGDTNTYGTRESRWVSAQKCYWPLPCKKSGMQGGQPFAGRLILFIYSFAPAAELRPSGCAHIWFAYKRHARALASSATTANVPPPLCPPRLAHQSIPAARVLR